MNSHHRMQNVRHRQMVQGYQPKPQPSNHRKQPQQGSWYQPPQPQQPQQRPWHRRAQPPPPLQPPPPPPPQRQQPSPPLQPPPPPLQPPPPPPQRPQPPPPLQPPPPPPPQRQQPPPPLQPPPPSPQRPQPLPPLQPPPPSPQRPQPPLRPVLSERPRLVEMPDNTLATVMAADGYRLGPTIGQGSYAKVRIATRDVPGGAAVTLACKIIDKKNGAGGDPSYLSKFLPRELDVLRRVRHPKLVATHSIYVTPSAVYVYMDYCKQGDLLQHLRRTNGIPLWQARTFFRQICDAVDYLHGSGISHRDIKCENILLDSMQVVKLADFGFARVSDGKDRLSNTHCGTPSYAAPEILQGKPYDPKAGDVWALGVVLYVMLGNCLPFRNSPRMVSNQMAKNLKRPKKPMCRESTDLISIILEPDVSKRITIGQIKSHSWFDEINL